MNEASIPKGPFFANALHCGSGESSGHYFFIPDVLFIPIESWDVRKHEVAHRVFAHSGTSGSDWLALRRLTGISHALCKNIYGLVTEHGLFIQGKRLEELRVSGKSSHRKTVEGLLRWLIEVERFIDALWHTLVPVAEIAAIDFSEFLDPRDPNRYIWRNTKLSATEREKVDKEKSRLIWAAVADYPPDFQESVRLAWDAYNKIDDDLARKELLRLAMSSFHPTEEWDLRLMSVAATKDLLDAGRNLIIVALVGADLHIRIFDASGKKVVDKAESELINGEILTALKKRLNPFPDESSLSKEDKQEIIRNATSITGHTPAEVDSYIWDPIKLILDNAAFAQQDAEEASKAFLMYRLNHSRTVFTWFERYIEPVGQYLKDGIREAWITIDLIQDVWKKIEDEPEKRGMPYAMTLGMYDVVHMGAGPWFSFLRFVWNTDGGGIASITEHCISCLTF